MSGINTTETNKALFTNTGIIAIGQISTKLINFFLLPLYTSMLTTEEYGLVDLLTTYTAFISVIVGLQMSQAIFRFLITSRNDEKRIEEISSTIVVASIIVILVYTILFLGLYPIISLQCKWFLLAHVISTLIFQLMSGLARGLGKNADYATGSFISAVVTLVLNVLFIAVFRLNISFMLAAYAIGPALGCLYLVKRVHIFRYLRLKSANKKDLIMVLNYAVPLVPNELSWSVIHASDRIIISHFLSIAANGLIAVASKFSAIYTTGFSIFNASWTEQVVLHYKDEGGKKYVNSMFEQMVTFFGCIAIGIIVCMPFVYDILVDQKFENAYGLVPFYMSAVFFNAVIGMISAIYLIENETKKIAFSTAIAATINIFVNILLIKHIGAYAAPVSSICGYAVISFWRLYDINKRHCKIGLSYSRLFVLCTMTIFTFVTYYMESTLIHCMALCVVAVISVIINKKILEILLSPIVHLVTKRKN